MRFDRPLEETIRARRSVRTYADSAIDAATMSALEHACSTLPRSPFGEEARFRVVERPFRRGERVKVSDYGLVRNPRYFLVGTIAGSPTALAGFGYLMEHLVLRATELGLGTCWMGLFNREYFPDVPVGEGELFPSIVVAGVPEGKRLGERVIRVAISADRRSGWDRLFFDGAFGRPLTGAVAGEYATPLEMLRLAPSAGNTQPWRVVRDAGGALHIHLQPRRRLYTERGLHEIDIGIAMAHLELAARDAGLEGGWRVADPGLDLPDGVGYRVSWFPA